MGHERLGALPRNKRWEHVVGRVDAYSEGEVRASEVARATIDNVQRRIQRIQRDEGVKATVQFLVGLAVASRENEPAESSPWKIPLPEDPTPLALGLSLRNWIHQNGGGGEYSEIASQAATEAIAQWVRRYKDVQGSIFEDEPHPYASWKKAGSGGGFSELSHLFFSNFTRRYLNYFLERVASSELDTIEDRERFNDEVAEHASETAKITQSFAAGWFNKHAAERLPKEEQVYGFLDFALGKIKEELLRERDAV
jgi:hypothetical protein